MSFEKDLQDAENRRILLNMAQESVDMLPDDIREKVSDGYHTFKELYDHRIILFVTLCNVMALHNADAYVVDDQTWELTPWKSKLHSDGTSWPGWFIAGLGKQSGRTVTYHLPDSYWDLLSGIQELEKAPEWDGHTSADVVSRLKALNA